MPDRLPIEKTHKLFINGAFPRSESGRSRPLRSPAGDLLANIAHASRKDLRDATEAARNAFPSWANASALNRGQVLYRLAEMVESRRAQFADTLAPFAPALTRRASPGPRARARRATAPPSPDAETARAIDRLVHYAGWADKYAQVLGCNNPVAGPYYNATVPEPVGVVIVVCPDAPALLGLIALLAPVLVPGNTAVLLASDANPLPAVALAEACATADLPPGVVNILTGTRGELLPHASSHRGVDAIHGANLAEPDAAVLRAGVAATLKRVTLRPDADLTDDHACQSPWWIEPFVEMKTIWHPASA